MAPAALLSQAASTWKRTKSAVLHRNIRTMPPFVRGDYHYITEKGTGLKLFDASCGAGVTILGNTIPPRVREVRDIVEDEIMHNGAMTGTHEATEEFARYLVGTTGGVMKHVSINNSGTDSVEAAIKMAIQYQTMEKPNPEPERCHIIGRQQSYSGGSITALAVGGYETRRAPFQVLFGDKFHHLPACNEYRQLLPGQSYEDFNAWHAQQLEDMIQDIGGNKVAAFIAEPVVGAALGCMTAPKGYFKAIRKVLDKYGILLIFDEIMCGMGRTGTRHAFQHEDVDVEPDILVLGKGLGAGVEAVSAMLIGEKISKALKDNTGIFIHGYTYQNFPKICAASHEIWKIIDENNYLQNVDNMGTILEQKLRSRLEHHPKVGNIRGRGLFWGIEFVRDKETKESFPRREEVVEKIIAKARTSAYKILLYGGTGCGANRIDGDSLMILPPFTINKDEVDLIVDQTANAIEDFFADNYPAH